MGIKPKLMLKIDFPTENSANVELVSVTDDFMKKEGYKMVSDGYDYAFYQGINFHINPKAKTFSFPRKCERQKIKLDFENERERYEKLKTLSRSLLLWSSSKIFEDNENPQLNYYKDLWVLF